METNGKMSSGDKTRHIHIRYFFIADFIKREKISIKYCPTDQMIADFYTKPLQGSLFKKLRDIIMVHTAIPVEERVEENSLHNKNNPLPRTLPVSFRI